MNSKQLLKEFMSSFGPSGYERDIAYLFKEKMQPLTDDIYIDRMQWGEISINIIDS